MTAELSVFGVFVPTILVAAVVAYAVTALAARGLRLVGFYRFVWHPALFNVALFVCVVGAVLFVVARISP